MKLESRKSENCEYFTKKIAKNAAFGEKVGLRRADLKDLVKVEQLKFDNFEGQKASCYKMVNNRQNRVGPRKWLKSFKKKVNKEK